MTLDEMRKQIREYPYQVHITRLPQAAGGHAYIPWTKTYAMLDDLTDGNWRFEVVSATAQGSWAVVHGRIILEADDGALFAEEVGCVPLTNQAPPFEVATRSAVKRAASTLGLARDLWQGSMPGYDMDDADHYSDNRQWRGDQERPQQARREPTPAPQRQEAQQYPEDRQQPQCQDCGVVVKTAPDGNPYRLCFNCNERAKAGSH